MLDENQRMEKHCSETDSHGNSFKVSSTPSYYLASSFAHQLQMLTNNLHTGSVAPSGN